MSTAKKVMLERLLCALVLGALLVYGGLRFVHNGDDNVVFDEFPRMLTPAEGVPMHADQALFTAKALVARHSGAVWWTQGQRFTLDMYHNPCMYPGVLVDVDGVVAAVLQYNQTENKNDPMVNKFGPRALRATLLTDGGVALDCDLCVAYIISSVITPGMAVHARGVVIDKCKLADGQQAVRFVGIIK